MRNEVRYSITRNFLIVTLLYKAISTIAQLYAIVLITFLKCKLIINVDKVYDIVNVTTARGSDIASFLLSCKWYKSYKKYVRVRVCSCKI